MNLFLYDPDMRIRQRGQTQQCLFFFKKNHMIRIVNQVIFLGVFFAFLLLPLMIRIYALPNGLPVNITSVAIRWHSQYLSAFHYYWRKQPVSKDFQSRLMRHFGNDIIHNSLKR